MKVIFAGGRDFYNKEIAEGIIHNAYSNHFLPPAHELTGISGRAIGADTTFSNVLISFEVGVDEFPAKWDDICSTADNPVKMAIRNGKPYNKLAGFNRNRLMSDIADKLIAVWNGSSGTKNMIVAMIKKDKPVLVYDYSGVIMFTHESEQSIRESIAKLNSLNY